MKQRQEGFFYSKYEPHFPVPEAHETAPASEARDLELLAAVEASSDTQTTHYRGFSCCRICGKINGSAEYSRDGWTWPAGYAHYIAEHHVWPSPEFRQFLRQTLEPTR